MNAIRAEATTPLARSAQKVRRVIRLVTGRRHGPINRLVSPSDIGQLIKPFVANRDTSFVLGSTIKHPHDLVMGFYSVHTNAAALERGEAEIRRIGDRLRASGRCNSRRASNP